jgi:hypothetical protein
MGGCIPPTPHLCFLLLGKETARERNTLEALKPVPHVGTFRDERSQWRASGATG